MTIQVTSSFERVVSTFLGSSVLSRPVPSLPPLFLPLPLLPFPSPSLPLALPLSSSPRLLACLPVRERRRRCRYAASSRGFEQLIDPDAGMDSYMPTSCAPFEQRRAGSSLRLQVDFKLANCAYVSDRTHSLTQSSCAIIARSRRVVALRITSRAPAAECLRPRAHIHTRIRSNSDAWLTGPPEAWAVHASAHGSSTIRAAQMRAAAIVPKRYCTGIW